MAPYTAANSELLEVTKRALIATAPALSSEYLAKRNMEVRGAQGLTLGVIAAYVVGIAILWNVPYLHYILWPFKVISLFCS